MHVVDEWTTKNEGAYIFHFFHSRFWITTTFLGTIYGWLFCDIDDMQKLGGSEEIKNIYFWVFGKTGLNFTAMKRSPKVPRKKKGISFFNLFAFALFVMDEYHKLFLAKIVSLHVMPWSIPKLGQKIHCMYFYAFDQLRSDSLTLMTHPLYKGTVSQYVEF